MSEGRVQELEEHRMYLFRYAVIRLRDPERAQDVVQETLLAAIEHHGSFLGNSSLRTWLTSILRNKIVDSIRKHARESIASDLSEAGESNSDDLDALFGTNGRWKTPPSQWEGPEGALDSAEFWRVFERCSQVMPRAMGQVFMMREFLDFSTEEICKELGISASNCHVTLYRARMRLRQCLDKNWFGGR